jgi:glycosyltransferase involved in cell wall biosynthesis
LKNYLHIITTIELGGAEKQLLILAEQQVQHGNTVTICFLKGRDELREKFVEIGASVLDDFANTSFLSQILFIRKFVLNQSFDVVHAHLPRSEILAAFLRKRSFRLILSRHNAEPFWPSSSSILSKFLSNIVTLRSDAVIAISKAVADYLIETREIINRRKIEVVLYGYSAQKESSKATRDSEIDFRIGTIGRLVPQKNYPTLLKAFSIAKINNSRISLHIVGDGYLKKDLQNLAKELQIEDSIAWLGRTDQITEFLEQLDLFILASEYEGFGLVLLEAMHSGIPILAANNSAIPEVLGTNYPGLFETFDQNCLADKISKQIHKNLNLLTFLDARKSLFEAERMYNEIEFVYKGLKN